MNTRLWPSELTLCSLKCLEAFTSWQSNSIKSSHITSSIGWFKLINISEKEFVSETLVNLNNLMWLAAQGYFIGLCSVSGGYECFEENCCQHHHGN
jgi:hypothetical protein